MPSTPDRLAAYASSLLALGEAAEALPRVEADLLEVQTWLRTEPKLAQFLGDPAIANAGKQAALQELLTGRVHPVVLHFLLLAQDLGLLPYFDALVAAFRGALASRQQRASGDLFSAVPVSAERVAAIEREVGRILDRQVSLHVREDPLLLGGLRVCVSDYVFDGTVDHQLERLRTQLLADEPAPPSLRGASP